jgi:hypothetical protein
MSKGREVSIYATHQTREGTHFLRPPLASFSVSPKMKRKFSSKKYINTAAAPATTATETTVTVPATAEIFTHLLEKPSEKHVRTMHITTVYYTSRTSCVQSCCLVSLFQAPCLPFSSPLSNTPNTHLRVCALETDQGILVSP